LGLSVAKRRKSEGRLIRRYGNRKLYDVQRSRYITLDGIRTLVQDGEDVSVIDNESGEDLTGVTFAQIIYEAERRTNGALSLPLLRRMVEVGDETVQRGREALESVREAAEQAEQSVQRLVERGAADGRKLLDDLFDVPQRRLDELQQRIDSRVRQSVERVTSNPTLRGELKRIEASLRQLEKKLGHIGPSSAPKANGAKRGKRKVKKRKASPRSRKTSSA
jgi:polyhydroxyalkanoate synthesis repressor PhaR